MPILNHQEINDIIDFRSFHNSWAVHIAEDLNKMLPKGFRATPHAQIGSREVDVRADRSLAVTEKEQLKALYQPSSPATVRAKFPTEIEVFILNVRRPAYKIVGAVEIISEGNKDRPASRNAFVAKCQNLLSQDVSLIIVDILALPSFNLHHQLLRALEIPEDKMESEKEPLYCVAYRKTFDLEELPALDFWEYELKIGGEFPKLPLFITYDVAVPVDLEKTYMEVCEGLKVFE